MADAVSGRIEYMKLEAELTSLRKMLNSRNLENNDHMKSRMTKQIEDIEPKFNAKKEELNALVYSLVEQDFWPIPPQLPSGPSTHTSDEKLKEVRAVVWQVKDQVAELAEQLQKRRADESATILAPTSIRQASSVENDNASANEARPAKRRRMSDSEPTLDERPSISRGSRRKELEGVQSHIEELENRLFDIENNSVQFSNDLQLEIDDRIEDKLLSLNLSGSPGGTMQQIGTNVLDTGQVTDPIYERLGELKAEFDRAGDDIKYVADVVADIIKKQQAAEAENQRLTDENKELKQNVSIVSCLILDSLRMSSIAHKFRLSSSRNGKRPQTIH